MRPCDEMKIGGRQLREDVMSEQQRRDLTLEELESEEALELPDRVEMSMIPGFVSAPALPAMPVVGAPALPANSPVSDAAPAPETPPVQ